ncbi:MAG: hypothetical protein JNG86_11320 [Verrucomicrobiaceae bacterium]|nr:hypothetical protein [Verrucomicrobiaceae bacterium]
MAAPAQEKWLYIDNSHLRLGVNLAAGGCIGWLSRSGSSENVLNAYDVGRYVQQSYYGDADGSDWDGKPWRYNPVQGGSWKNEPAEVVETKSDATSLYAKTIPRHWATGVKTPECVMEQWLRLDGDVARLKFKMTYSGEKAHVPHHQELPALFVEPRFDTLAFLDAQNELVRLQPGFPNEYPRVAGSWCAWIDSNNKGIGLHMPHTRQITCYRVRNGNKADCSYLAPIQTFALKPGLVFEYEVALALGTLEQIRAAFTALK